MIGFQQITLCPGQFIFGRKKAAEDLGMSEQTIRTSLDSLRKSQNITIKTTNKFSIISVINWETYQSQENQNNQQNNQPLTSNQPTTNHIQERKKGKKEEYSVDFKTFYDAYPNKKAPDDAWRAWQKRNGDRPPLQTMLDAISKQISWRKNPPPGEFIPNWKHPATWLSKGSWADEIPEPINPYESAAEREWRLKNEQRKNGV
jgi:hypothetical protein